MSDSWDDMFEATIETMRFTCAAHSVMSARLLLFAIGAPNAVDEAAEMVAEKITAFSHAGMAAEQALSEGLGFFAAAERAYRLARLRSCQQRSAERRRAPKRR
jgi:hypothetical protein